MDRRTKIGVGVGAGFALLVGVALVPGGGAAPRPVWQEPAPEPRREAQVQVARPVPEGAAPDAAPAVEASPIGSSWRRTALASVHAAPALGLDDLGAEAGGESSVAVDPCTGLATLWEQDASLAGWPALRRARTLGDESTGLFGRGWRSEVEASLHRDGDGFVVARIDGLTRLRPAGRGVWLSELGEVQALVATKDGYQVDDPAGRVHTFDRQGQLVAIEGELTVERSPGALRVVGRSGTITLELDGHGRVTRARAAKESGGVDVRYSYEGDELVRVEGTARRTYRTVATTAVGGAGLEVGGAAGAILVASLDDRACLASLEAPARAAGFVQRYAFARGSAEVTGPSGRWSYQADGDGWQISTPTGPERARLDERGRVTGLSVAGGPFLAVPRRGALEQALAERSHGVAATTTAAAPSRVTRERDAAGRVVVETGPAGRTELERDSAGRVRARTDGAGRTTRAIRDRAGRVESITGDEGTELAFELDLAGRPTRATSGEHDLRFAWDGLGRQLSETGPDARLTWSYGPRSEQVASTWGTFTRETDATGRVVSLASPAGSFRWEHDDQGRVARVHAPNGVVTELRRDAAGRESVRTARDRKGRSLLALSTSRDAAGLAIALRRDGAVVGLARDARGLLTRASGAGVDLAYAWGPGGDRIGAERLEHDGAGRLVRREGAAGATRYGWDDLGRLTRVERRPASGASETVRYAYDGLGRLATRTTSAGTTRFVHADGQLLAELGPGERVRVWVHGPGLDAPLAYGDGRAGETPTWTYLHGDATETTLAYSDERGARVAQAVEGPFGETVAAPGADRPVLFAGRQVDPDTGLVNLRARWYAPELGRFLDADPIGPDGGDDPWLYCGGDPVERRDPLGLSPSPWSGTPELPTVWDRLVSVTNAGVDLAARLVDQTRVAVADVIAHDQATTRDLQVDLTRFGLLDPPGRAQPTYTESWVVNFCHDATSAVVGGLLDGRQGGLALLHDAIAPDAHDLGVSGDALQGYREAALGYGDAMRRGQEHYVQVVDQLMDDGHDPASAFTQTVFVMAGEHLIPVVKAREVVEGKDLRHFVDTGDERRLSTQERVQRGLEVGTELVGAGLGALTSRAAKAARATEEALALARASRAAAAGEAADDAARAGRAARGAEEAAAARRATPAGREPSNGLAQALDSDAERGAARAADGPEARSSRGDGPEVQGPGAGRPPRRELPVVQEDGCFLAGTLVVTSTGRRPIETITVGDRVLARSERTGANAWRRVTRLFPNLTAVVTSLWIASASPQGAVELQTIRCTPNHPFWRAGDGFVRADQLRAGDGLSTAASTPALVVGAQTVGWRAPTFNFEVETDHTYFVSESSAGGAVWVHNTCEEALRARFEAATKDGTTSQTWEEYRRAYVDRRTQELGFDPARKRLQPHEGRIGAELELRGEVDGELERLVPRKDAPPGTKTPEWQETGGRRRTFDEFGGSMPDHAVEKQLSNGKLEKSLKEHFEKADVTVVQITQLNEANRQEVRELVRSLQDQGLVPAGKEVWVVDY